MASAPFSGAIAANSNALDLASWSGGSEHFNGTVDDIAVYPGALSAARVGAHYLAGFGAPPPDPTVKDPSGLTASAVSDTRIDLKWVDNSTNEGEFLIQRDTSPGFGSRDDGRLGQRHELVRRQPLSRHHLLLPGAGEERDR